MEMGGSRRFPFTSSPPTITWACWVFPFVMWEQEDMMTSLHKEV